MPQQGFELLSLVFHHPMTEYDVKAYVQTHLERYQKVIPEDVFDAAMVQGRAANLDTVIIELEQRLTTALAHAA